DELQTTLKVGLLIKMSRSLAHNLFIITIVLYLLDTLSPVQVSLVWMCYFTTLALVDYPTGNLGDIWGYRRVLKIAYLTQILSIPFIIFNDLLGIVISDSEFYSSLIFMVLFAIGSSQESGALEAWLDNRYHQLVENKDNNRETYKGFLAKSGPFINVMSVIGFVLGGFISSYYSRKLVFIIFMILLIGLWFMINVFVIETKSQQTGAIIFFKQLQDSFTVFLRNKVIFTFFIGLAIIGAANESIWYTFLLFRLYRDYTGSDVGAGIIRGLIFLLAIFWQLVMIRFIRHFKREYFWVFIATLLSNAIFFLFIKLYYVYFPPTNFNIYLILGFILIYHIPIILEALQGILEGRIMLDLIPDNYRNSLYSLLPTIARLFGIPFVLISGWIVANYGLIQLFYFLILVSLLGSILLGISFKIVQDNLQH
ncbi:MAG: hypothetical protein OEZ01_03650, partial [Candidatus Heimdallarchaeota archaeon]|nr:hypothetical protein [Candidatus Heimdallarchaeota archaeon]